MTTSRRNIYINNDYLDNYLETCPNVSNFFQEAALFYLQEKDNVYAKKSDLEEVKREVEILNKNYLQQKDALNKLVDNLFRKDWFYLWKKWKSI